MRKQLIRLIALLLCGLIVFGLAATAFADEPEQEQPLSETGEEAAYIGTVAISSVEDFLRFAENCRLDTYSQNMYFTLEADIDLTGVEFAPIPIFCGTFEGNGHTVSGLAVTVEGSYQGLFRYVDMGAVIQNLRVEGTVAPRGSAGCVGGIAGRNSGLIQGCSFAGTLEGVNRVGGIAGANTLTGIIQNCTGEGSVSGSHFVGGIAGENSGVIRYCENSARINTTVKQNSVDISDISLETLTGAESIATVTDIGGIVGGTGGVVRECVNRGDVGYPHIGYNIGGIAGSQNGYLTACENYGTVSGRKEVGGIAGQMEPATYMEFTEDTLQILEEQMAVLSALTTRATVNAQDDAAELSGELSQVEGYVDDAMGALETLIPTEDNPVVDPDTLLAARGVLSDSMTGIRTSLGSIASGAWNLASNLGRDLEAVMDQVGIIGQTLNNASEGLGGSIRDISDLDTEEDILAKIILCQNHGAVMGDWNVGGVLGAAAYENDLDPEDDLTMGGDSSMNFDIQVRAVVLLCENTGNVTVKNRNAGGIAGWMYLGLLRDCVNTGNVEAAAAEHVGGIAGLSSGYIRVCGAKCVISGKTYVGGVAGEGSVITACGTMVCISGGEKLGAIAGWVEDLTGNGEELPVLGNYYLAVDGDPGGIDGVSYGGKAECAGEEAFFAMEQLLDVFHTVTVTFLQEDGTAEQVVLEYGEALSSDKIPEVTPREGCTGTWEGLEEADLSRVTFDRCFSARYIPGNATIAADVTDENGMPLVFAQGEFLRGGVVTLRPLTDETVLQGWNFILPENGIATQLRCRIPAGTPAERIALQVLGGDGNWRDVEFTTNGSYLVFPVAEGDSAFRLVQTEQDYSVTILVSTAAAVAAVLTVVAIILKKKKKK